ncbi:MAG: protein-L-isoaspartate O-methyltransferase family protein [Beijerinckiaceae bacterium]
MGTLPTMSDFAAARRNMVDTQLRTYDVTSHRVLDAVEAVARDKFVPSGMEALAYSDRPVAITAADGLKRHMLQPMVLARLLQALDVKQGDKALDCAGGAGYGAALLSALGASVTAIEESEAMAALMRERLAAAGVSGVDVRSGPIAAGTDGRFDVIVVHGAAEIEPDSLLRQLADGGRLGVVMGHGRAGRAVVFSRVGGVIGRRTVFDAAAAALPGFVKMPEFSL